ncbi:hypothetical protein HpSIM21_03450 [Helicobacter pylori]|nr:hypothetical protein VN0926_05590 [Helicobacter pylori]
MHWVKGSQYCAWWEFAGCLKNVWGANHKGYDAGNAANYLYSQNYQAIFVGSGNETGTYSLSGFTNYVGGDLTINLGDSVVLDLSGSNSFTSYQGYHQGKDDVSFNVGAINLNGALEVGNRVGSGVGMHTGTATLNLNANQVNINSNISTFKTSQVNIGNANSTITIGLVSLSGDTCSSLARVGVGANCSTSGPSYSFKGTTNATNTAFSNASGSFTFEENATFSGAKLNRGTFTFNKEFSATNNSDNFNFKGTSSFNGANFSNTGKITINESASFNDTTFNTSINMSNISNMTITGSVTLSGFNGNIMHSLANNVDVGMYARAFLKRNEFTLSANETYEGNTSNINSSNSLLSVLNQRYSYNTWTTSVNGNYGYDFMFKQKSVVLKPQVGLSYHFIGLSGMKGKMNDAAYKQFLMHSNPSNESVLTLNVGLESRKYFGKNSYYFVTARLGRDLLINSKGDNAVRFVGENTLLYRKGEVFNTFASVITGGEMHLWRLVYVNAGVGLKMGLQYQDINITGNVGMRVAF